MNNLTHQLPQASDKVVEREPLQWLFIAFFKDGSTINQTPLDRSYRHDENKEANPSAFTDVLEREEDLVAFELHHIDGDKIASVYLDTGLFAVNGVPLQLHEQNFEPENHALKLVYFRENRIDRVINGVVNEDMSVSQEDAGIRHYVNRYFIGWTTEVNGKEKQVTLAVG